VNGLIRAVQAAGGFATVIAKGERDAGTLLIICCENDTNVRIYERMPQLDGSRSWSLLQTQDVEKPSDFTDYWKRRKDQDPDLWVLELNVANAERFIGLTGTSS
jgi:hypothetical protein